MDPKTFCEFVISLKNCHDQYHRLQNINFMYIEKVAMENQCYVRRISQKDFNKIMGLAEYSHGLMNLELDCKKRCSKYLADLHEMCREGIPLDNYLKSFCQDMDKCVESSNGIYDNLLKKFLTLDVKNLDAIEKAKSAKFQFNLGTFLYCVFILAGFFIGYLFALLKPFF